MPVQTTNIGWCDDSANHWVGCARVSSGCLNCWAADIAGRFDRTPEPWTIANVEANLQVYDEDISDLLSRRRPGWCFFPSSSDPYLPWLTDVAACPGDGCDETLWTGEGGLRCRECGWYGYAAELVDAHTEYLGAIRANDHHCFQVLTKWGAEDHGLQRHVDWPAHVILGVTVETNRRDYRLDWLREQDAATKFVSFEPLLEPIEAPDLSGIDWAIIGGESGTDRREWDPSWAADLIVECSRQDVAPFFKQHGHRFPEPKAEDRPHERTMIQMGDWYGEIRHFPHVPADVPPAPQEYLAATP